MRDIWKQVILRIMSYQEAALLCRGVAPCAYSILIYITTYSALLQYGT